MTSFILDDSEMNEWKSEKPASLDVHIFDHNNVDYGLRPLRYRLLPPDWRKVQSLLRS